MNATTLNPATAGTGQVLPDLLRPRSAERATAGVAIALLAHLLLIGGLSLGVSWRMTEPEGGEVELWDGIPQAAPAALPPVQAAPAPVAKPAPPVVEPEPVKPVEQPPADLADASQPEVVKPPKPVKHKPPPEPVVAKVAPKPAAKAAKPTAADQTAKAEALKSQREAAMSRMLSELGAEGGGGAARSNKPAGGGHLSNAYSGRIKARVKPNIVFTEAISGNPMAVVRVRCDATGHIVGQQLVESSGVPAWDEAVQRAITRTEVLPLDEEGRCPTMELAFRPQDF